MLTHIPIWTRQRHCHRLPGERQTSRHGNCPRPPWTACLVAALLGALGASSRLAAQPPEFGNDASDAPAELLFEPKNPRSEQDEDRRQATVQYAHGRMLLQRDDAAGALRRFERAYRYDPQGTVIVQEIISLATAQKRHSEAVRYAILLAERQGGDPRLLRQLAAILVEQGKLDRAAAMYDRALAAAPPDRPPDRSDVLLRAELGRLYLVLEKYDQAVGMLTVLHEALDQPEKFGFTGDAKNQLLAEEPRLFPLIGEGYLRAGRDADAEAIFRRAQQNHRNEPLLFIQLARVAVERKDWSSAEEVLNQYFASKSAIAGLQPYELLARVLTGKLTDEARVREELLRRLQQLHEQDPQNVPLGYALAARLAGADQYDRAAALYADLLSRQPTAAGLQELAAVHQKQRDVPGLLKLLRQLIERDGVRGSLGAVGEKIAQDAPLVELLVKALQPQQQPAAEPPSYATLVGVALVAITAHQPAVAEELYERALGVPQAPRNKIHEIIGLGAMLGEQPALAARALARAIDAGPTPEMLATCYFYLAGAEEFAGHTDAALQAAEQCAKLLPDSPQHQARPAWVLYHARRTAEAEQRYGELLTRFDGQHHSDEIRDQVRQIRLILSNICVLQQRLPQAEEWLEQVLDEFPEDDGAYNDLGYLWADQRKHLKRALVMCQHAVAAEPDNGAYRDSLGWAYFRLGRLAEAVVELEKAARLTPDGVIFDHLGDVYASSHEVAKARSTWQRAVEHFDKSAEHDKSRQVAVKIEQLPTP